ncbi:hypothetical protein PHMEG_00011496 [Phytophthora megakarya]|uniref:Uncharacterized protein n=1 Tax=Phytophthora megakarya TaxID=4795 RepID=A0A225WD58_9STRA|nr:hypothetical protein PHMEG_00011496 [Phytophthora megakarya]
MTKERAVGDLMKQRGDKRVMAVPPPRDTPTTVRKAISEEGPPRRCDFSVYDTRRVSMDGAAGTRHGVTEARLVLQRLRTRGAARVKLVETAKLLTNTCRRVELAVAAPEGTTGLLVPAQRVEPHLMLTPTLTTVRKSWIARNARFMDPTTEDKEILDIAGGLERDKVKQWLEILSTNKEKLANEDE